jgi:hypothetical protein
VSEMQDDAAESAETTILEPDALGWLDLRKLRLRDGQVGTANRVAP